MLMAGLCLLPGALYAPEAAAQMGGAFPQFEWGGRFQASFLYGTPADDGFASLFNPAALRACVGRQISVQQIRPFDVPLTALGWCAGQASGAEGRVIWSWGGHAVVRQSPAGLGFDYTTYQLGLTAAMGIGLGRGTATLGATPKLLIVSIDGTGTSMDETASGFGLDAGLAYEHPIHVGAPGQEAVLDTLSLDVAVIDAVNRIRYKSGASERGATPVQRLALSAAGPRWTVGVTVRRQDAESTWSGGVEWAAWQTPVTDTAAVLRRITLRAGADTDGHGPAVGLGVVLRGFSADYAYRMDDGHGTHVFSTSWRF